MTPREILETTKSVVTANGYRLHYWYVDGMRFSCFAHRAVWAMHFGEIPPGYAVHHEDGNKLNNDIGNLRCMLFGEHSRLTMADKDVSALLSRARTDAAARRLLKQTRKWLPAIERLLRQGLSLSAVAHSIGISRQRIEEIIAASGYKMQTFTLLVPAPDDNKAPVCETQLPVVDYLDFLPIEELSGICDPVPHPGRPPKYRTSSGDRIACQSCRVRPATAKALCRSCYDKQRKAKRSANSC